MAAYQYEPLKCEGCGKTLGYIYISAKTGLFGLSGTRYWLAQHAPAIDKTAFCESCFQKKLDEISKGKAETKSEKDKRTESRAKPRDRPLIR